jgi:hypothetical protein
MFRGLYCQLWLFTDGSGIQVCCIHTTLTQSRSLTCSSLPQHGASTGTASIHKPLQCALPINWKILEPQTTWITSKRHKRLRCSTFRHRVRHLCLERVLAVAPRNRQPILRSCRMFFRRLSIIMSSPSVNSNHPTAPLALRHLFDGRILQVQLHHVLLDIIIVW